MRMSGRSSAGGNRGVLIKNHQVALFSDLVSLPVAELRLAPLFPVAAGTATQSGARRPAVRGISSFYV